MTPSQRNVAVDANGRVCRGRYSLDEWRGCISKVRFELKRRAQGGMRDNQEVYRCRYCGDWHRATKKRKAHP